VAMKVKKRVLLFVLCFESWNEKGPGDAEVQRRSIEECLKEIASSSDLSGLLGDLSEEESVSVVLQPFIISPLINLTDALVAAASLARRDERFDTAESARRLVLRSLALFPPFPVFERLLQCPAGRDLPAGTHVFVLADEMGAALPDTEQARKEHDFLGFGGTGARSCPGRTAAMVRALRLFVLCWFVTCSCAGDSGGRGDGRLRRAASARARRTSLQRKTARRQRSKVVKTTWFVLCV
jgi:hypothetical protein